MPSISNVIEIPPDPPRTEMDDDFELLSNLIKEKLKITIDVKPLEQQLMKILKQVCKQAFTNLHHFRPNPFQ